MLSLPTPASQPIARQVLALFRQRKHLPVKRLSLRLHLIQDLCFELLDVVDIILDLEQHFHLHIPDEVVFDTIGDFVKYVAARPAAGPAMPEHGDGRPALQLRKM